MSVFEAGAPQFCSTRHSFPNSQFRAGNNGVSLRFVSSGGFYAKWRDVPGRPIRPMKGGWMRGPRQGARAILVGFVLCSAFVSREGKAEPSAEVIAKGKALTEIADCASCHTADPAKPFAGGKRIETPFGGIYSPNLTPDPATGLGRWNDEDFVRA